MIPPDTDLRGPMLHCAHVETEPFQRGDARVAGGWRSRVLTGAFSHEHPGLGFCSFSVQSSRFTIASLYCVTLPVSQPPPAFREGHELTVPVLVTISEVSCPSEETAPLLLPSKPSAAPHS